MGIMTQFLENHNIDVPYFARMNELENHIEPLNHYHNAQPQGKKIYGLSAIVKYFSHFFNLDTHLVCLNQKPHYQPKEKNVVL